MATGLWNLCIEKHLKTPDTEISDRFPNRERPVTLIMSGVPLSG